MGHADDKKSANPETITSFEEENIECDAEAEDEVNLNCPSQFRPLPGYKAMLQLDGQWITTRFRAV